MKMFHGWKRRFLARWSLRMALDKRLLSELLALGMLIASTVAPGRRGLSLLTSGIRRSETPASRKLAKTLLAPRLARPALRDRWREERVGWERYTAGTADILNNRALTTSLVLKAPGPGGEKGVLYSSFEFNWMRLLVNHDIRALLREYLLVGASSWSPTDHAVLASFQGLSDDPVFIGISNAADVEQYRLWEAGGGVTPVPITAGDWIDPAMYRPRREADRDIDVIMVSHFARWKRHWLLFDAMRRMNRNLRVVIVGRDADGRTANDLWRDAHAFGVDRQIEIHKKLEIEEVAALQARSRVAVALSRREGSCVSVTEAMFADTPVVMMADAHVGTRRYINERTGRIARGPRGLARAIEEMLDHRERVAPRQWALGNISAARTSANLNALLRDHCVARGQPWTRDIKPMCWRYVPAYLDPADEILMRPAREKLQSRYGIELADFRGEHGTRTRPVEVEPLQEVA